MRFAALQTCLVLLVGALHTTCSEDGDDNGHIHLNQWAVEIHSGEQKARKIAVDLGFSYVGPIGNLDNFFMFEHHDHSKRSRRQAGDKTKALEEHYEVHWAEQQRVVRRVKRSALLVDNLPQPGGPFPLPPSDPYWTKMWYHKRRFQTPQPVWERGFTGRGVVVSILDDGIDYTHPDLVKTYDAKASYDFNSEDADPIPRPTVNDENKHGTRCAGEVAATSNDNCIIGVAFNSSVGGIRMLDGDVTDIVEGSSLSFRPQHIDIYSSSWGPDDDGRTVDGPARLARQAFQQGALKGRGGLGSIFVWASGNGGRYGDSCSCDGYPNTIYTISVSSASERGSVPWYSEPCSSTLATIYSSGGSYEQRIVTVDLHHLCTTSHTGTSASAPMAAGLLALVLEANPHLTWRDMQHLVVLTSQPEPLDQKGWVTNGVGRRVSHSFGYGLMHTAGLVNLARHWKTVPKMHTCIEENIKPFGKMPGEYILEATGCLNTEDEVIYMENVVATVTATTESQRGMLSIVLTSPAGTPSTLLPQRWSDHSARNFDKWNFRSTRTWGEHPAGTWKLTIVSGKKKISALRALTLRIYGTKEKPAFLELPKECHSLCVDGCVGPSAFECHSCKQKTIFHQNGSFECIAGDCPAGYFSNGQTRCSPCHSSCWSCKGALASECTVCPPGRELTNGHCRSHCPAGQFYNKSVCVKCGDSSCKRCLGPGKGQCIVCRSRHFLLHGACVSQCPSSGTFAIDRSCVPCHKDCKSCSAAVATACTSCHDDHVLFAGNGSCVENCPLSFFKDGSACSACPPHCDSCSSPSTCLVCSNSYLLSKEALCVLSCPDGTFASDGGTVCKPCDMSCKTCRGSASACVDCADDNFLLLSQGTCVASCPVGFFIKAESRNCARCSDEHCEVCGDDGSSCSRCGSPYLLHTGSKSASCLSQCPSGFFTNVAGSRCVRCLAECVSCQSANMCTACVPPRLLHNGKCLEQCPDGFVESQGTCHQCHTTCNTCHGLGPSNCTGCFDGEVLTKSSTCVTSCSDGTFSDSGRCKDCSVTCAKCSGAGPGHCTGCVATLVLHGGQCLPSCPRGLFANSGSCALCHESCTNCSGGMPTDCLSCSDPTHVLHRGVCVDSCPDGFVKVERRCTACHPSCKRCSSPSITQCSACVDGLVLNKSGSCVSECKGGTFRETLNSTTCQACSSSCASCTERPTKCLSCSDNKHLFNYSCVASCPDGSFPGISKHCKFCHPVCSTCKGPGQEGCTRCLPPHLRFGHTCVQACPPGHATVDGACIDCVDSSCLECVDPSVCKACSGPRRFLNNGSCVSTCPPKRFPDVFNNCVECDPSCDECTDNGSDKCTACVSPNVLSNGVCAVSCPPRFFADSNRVCQACSSDCVECNMSAHACTRCQPGQALAPNLTCLFKCPSGMVLNSSAQRCVSCPAQCEQCHSSDKCTHCAFPHLRFNGMCVKKCPDGFFSNGGSCQACHRTCKTCSGNFADCLSCRSNYILSDKSCKIACGVGQFLNSSSHSCTVCHTSCQACDGSSPNDCIACQDGFFLLRTDNGSLCARTCPLRTVANAKRRVCETCHPHCKTCLSSSSEDCAICADGYKLVKSRCVPSCASGHHLDSVTGQCAPCNNSCESCVNQHSCLSCVSGHRLSLVDSLCYPCCNGPFDKIPCCNCSHAPADTCISPRRQGINRGKLTTGTVAATSTPLTTTQGGFANKAAHVMSVIVAGTLVALIIFFFVSVGYRCIRKKPKKYQYKPLIDDVAEGMPMMDESPL